MLTEADFLAAVLAEPEDDAPRLIMADWLDEQGQGERAEFIRVQCAAARMPIETRHGHLWECLHKRELELPNAHVDGEMNFMKWSAPLGGLFPWPRLRPPEFRRGFVHSITCAWRDCRDHLNAILAEQPVREVMLTTMPDSPWYWSNVHGIPSQTNFIAALQKRWPYIQKWELLVLPPPHLFNVRHERQGVPFPEGTTFRPT